MSSLLSGHIQGDSLIMVMQLLNQSGQSGRLMIISDTHGGGEINYQSGEIINARAEGENEVIPAILRLTLMSAGEYEFVLSPMTVQRRLSVPYRQLSMDLAIMTDYLRMHQNHQAVPERELAEMLGRYQMTLEQFTGLLSPTSAAAPEEAAQRSAGQLQVIFPDVPAPARTPAPQPLPEPGAFPKLLHSPAQLSLTGQDWQIIQAVQSGMSVAQIASSTGQSLSHVQAFIAHHIAQGTMSLTQSSDIMPEQFWEDALQAVTACIGPASVLLLSRAARETGLEMEGKRPRIPRERAGEYLDAVKRLLPPGRSGPLDQRLPLLMAH